MSIKKPLWEYPRNYNFNEAEGREAFTAGQPIDWCPYGESSAAADWKRGWQAEQAKAERAKAEAAKVVKLDEAA